MRCAFACLVHCYITVEACANGYAAWFLQASSPVVDRRTAEALERLDTATKLIVYPLLFAGRSVFDASQEPYQSFALLKKWRDRFAVHPKPQMILDEGVAVARDGGLRVLDAESKVSSLSALGEWKQVPKCDAAGAAWACDVVRKVAEKLSLPGGELVFDLAVFDDGD